MKKATEKSEIQKYDDTPEPNLADTVNSLSKDKQISYLPVAVESPSKTQEDTEPVPPVDYVVPIHAPDNEGKKKKQLSSEQKLVAVSKKKNKKKRQKLAKKKKEQELLKQLCLPHIENNKQEEDDSLGFWTVVPPVPFPCKKSNSSGTSELQQPNLQEQLSHQRAADNTTRS